jgi:hypothetical protein
MHTRKAKLTCSFVALLTAIALAGCGEVVETGKPAKSPESPTADDQKDWPDLDEEGDVDSADTGGDVDDEGMDEVDDDGAEDDGKVAKPKGGSRDLTEIANLVKARRDPVRACYERALKRHPGLKGKMVIHFELDPEGKVTKAELNQQRSKITVKEVVDCAIKVINEIKFPASEKGMVTEVNYPYDLNP